MSRNFGVTRPPVSGGQPLTASHYAPGTQRNSGNSFAGATPPRPADLAIVIGDRPFLSKRELNPVEPLGPGFDHREFAAYIFLSVFGVSVGVLLAIGVALLDWS